MFSTPSNGPHTQSSESPKVESVLLASPRRLSFEDHQQICPAPFSSSQCKLSEPSALGQINLTIVQEQKKLAPPVEQHQNGFSVTAPVNATATTDSHSSDP